MSRPYNFPHNYRFSVSLVDSFLTARVLSRFDPCGDSYGRSKVVNQNKSTINLWPHVLFGLGTPPHSFYTVDRIYGVGGGDWERSLGLVASSFGFLMLTASLSPIALRLCVPAPGLRIGK